MTIKQVHCPNCGPVVGVVCPVAHFRHFVLTLVTCGFWAGVWVFLILNPRFHKVNCQKCGLQI